MSLVELKAGEKFNGETVLLETEQGRWHDPDRWVHPIFYPKEIEYLDTLSKGDCKELIIGMLETKRKFPGSYIFNGETGESLGPERQGDDGKVTKRGRAVKKKQTKIQERKAVASLKSIANMLDKNKLKLRDEK